MKARILIACEQCSRTLGSVTIDTADMPEELQATINNPILEHRKECPYHAKKYASNSCEAMYLD